MRGIRKTLRSGQTPLTVAPLRFVDIETTGLRPDRGARGQNSPERGDAPDTLCPAA